MTVLATLQSLIRHNASSEVNVKRQLGECVAVSVKCRGCRRNQ